MTATKHRIPREQAFDVIDELFVLLEPSCRRLHGAGSMRRGSATVSDIELLAVPRIDTQAVDLFGEVLVDTNRLDLRARELIDEGVLAHRLDKLGRLAFGERYKRLRHVRSGVALDLFSCLPPAQWGVLLTIRTGPAEFSQRLVTAQSRGGLLPNHLLIRDGALYRHVQGADLPTDTEARRRYPAEWLTIVPTPTEESLFESLGMAFVLPEDRERVAA